MNLTGQWADSLLALERLFFLKLLIWGGLSTLGGTASLSALSVRRLDAPLLRHFGVQGVAWGLALIAVAMWGRAQATLRNFATVASLERIAWFASGLAIGLAAVGATLVIVAWHPLRRDSLIGAGIGLGVQGLALVALLAQLSASIVR